MHDKLPERIVRFKSNKHYLVKHTGGGEVNQLVSQNSFSREKFMIHLNSEIETLRVVENPPSGVMKFEQKYVYSQ